MAGDRAIKWKTGLKHRNHHKLWGKHAVPRENDSIGRLASFGLPANNVRYRERYTGK